MLSQPHPELPLKRLVPNPQPQPSLFPLNKESRRMIQIMELHPHPELLFPPQPQFVAVKSLIILPPKFFIYGLYYVLWLASVCHIKNIF